MDDQIQKIVTELPDLEDVSGVSAMAAGRLAQGDAAFLADLGIALARTYGSGQMWQYSSVFGRLLELPAATAGAENVAQALRLVSSAEVANRRLDRYTASLLASSQETTDLAAAFTGSASEELRACLVHELVLRGFAVEETPGMAGWVTSSHWSHHPLSWLPLTMSDVEGHAYLPPYIRGGSIRDKMQRMHGGSRARLYRPGERRELAVIAGANVPSVEEATPETVATAMARAVVNWAEGSNGCIEARVFELAEPLDAASVPSALLTMGLECLHGMGKQAALSVTAHPPAEASLKLFQAASKGGAFTTGFYGAYGRLAAWQSLAALAGCPEGATADEVEASVRDCIWHSFGADTKWFRHMSWDLGLAALAPDRRRLAVLAATDTD